MLLEEVMIYGETHVNMSKVTNTYLLSPEIREGFSISYFPKLNVFHYLSTPNAYL